MAEPQDAGGQHAIETVTEREPVVTRDSGDGNDRRLDAGRGWRAAFAALLLFAMAVPTFLQVAVAVLAPFLTDEFDLSAGQIGILGTALFLPAALAAPTVGHLVDVVGARRIAAILFATASVSIFGFAFAPSYGWLVAMAAANGLAHAASNPATNRLIATHLPVGRRGLILGIKQSGVKVSQFLAGALMPAAAIAFGWRGALLIAAGVCALGIPAVFTVLPPRTAGRARRSSAPRRRSVGATLVRLASFAFLMAVGQSALYLYLPLYSHDELGLSVRAAGFTIGLIGLLAIFARIAWGPVAERFSSAAIPLTMLSVGAVVSQLAILTASAGRIGPLWIGVFGLSLTAAVWNTAANYAVITRFDESQTGWASGFLQSAFLLGLALGPLLAGSVIEATDSYRTAWLGVFVTFGLAAIVSLQWWISERRAVPAAAGGKDLAFQRTQ